MLDNDAVVASRNVEFIGHEAPARKGHGDVVCFVDLCKELFVLSLELEHSGFLAGCSGKRPSSYPARLAEPVTFVLRATSPLPRLPAEPVWGFLAF